MRIKNGITLFYNKLAGSDAKEIDTLWITVAGAAAGFVIVIIIIIIAVTIMRRYVHCYFTVSGL